MKTAIELHQESIRPPCCDPAKDTLPIEEQNISDSHPSSDAHVTLSVNGMTCGSCASKVQTVLRKIGGVHSAQVMLAESVAHIRYDARQIGLNEMISALESAGYTAEAGVTDSVSHSATQFSGSLKRPVVSGAGAALAVIAFYLGLITVTSDWSNAAYQFSEYGSWVIALAAGLSLQVGIFTWMRRVMAGMHVKGSGKSIAASGSMSGVAMALCCSHYLATLLPAIGLPFLSGAVAGLAQHQTTFFVIGVVSNILGLTYMLKLVMKSGVLRFGTV